MKPEEKLLIALELSELVREIARQGIRTTSKRLGKKAVERKLWERIGR